MRIFTTYLLCLFASISFGQKTSVSLEPKKIQVGEHAQLTYSIILPSEATYKHIPFGNSIPSRKKEQNATLTNELSSDLEQVQLFHDTIFKKGNQKIWKGTYEVTGWNEGTYVISGSKIVVNDSSILFPDAILSVSLVKAEKGKDIYDIEESYSKLPPEPNVFFETIKNNSWLIILMVLILVFILFIIIRNKKRISLQPIIEMTLKERSLLAIDLLEKERLWEKGKLKEHYIELSYILRSYLSSRYELNLLEKTTKETQLLLSQKGLHSETINVISTVLDQSDLVKFARSAPEESEVLKISQFVRQVIAETSPIDFDHAE